MVTDWLVDEDDDEEDDIVDWRNWKAKRLKLKIQTNKNIAQRLWEMKRLLGSSVIEFHCLGVHSSPGLCWVFVLRFRWLCWAVMPTKLRWPREDFHLKMKADTIQGGMALWLFIDFHFSLSLSLSLSLSFSLSLHLSLFVCCLSDPLLVCLNVLAGLLVGHLLPTLSWSPVWTPRKIRGWNQMEILRTQ